MDSTLAGLLGALLGSFASLLGLFIQQHFQAKRDRTKIAAELGLADYQHDLEIAKSVQGVKIAPVAAYVYYHNRIFEEMSKGKIDARKIKAITAERDSL